MDKIISWFYFIMFISLVPLGAFFDAKQPLKPNMEQSCFMKREKRATNPSQCGNNCELEFSEISNSYLRIFTASPFAKAYFINIDDVKNQLPSDIVVSDSGFKGFEDSFKIDDDILIQKIQDFYKFNMTKVVNGNTSSGAYYQEYSINKLVDVKITFSNQNYNQEWYITSFSAKMPH